MNREEILQKIEELKELVKEHDEKSKFWRADEGKSYYWIWCDVCYEERELYCESDNGRYACGNYKPTKEAAEADAKFIKCMHKLRNAARQLNDGWVPDWNDSNTYKWCIGYNHHNTSFTVYSVLGNAFVDVYFKSERLAMRALDMLDDEDKEVLKGLA